MPSLRTAPLLSACRLAGLLLGFLLLSSIGAEAQRELGELHLEVQDPQGAPVAAAAELISDANQVRRSFSADSDGRATAQDLPFGLYRLTTTHAGFAPNEQTVEIRSEVPIVIKVTLGLATVETQVQVTAAETLVDPNRTSPVAAIGSQMIQEEVPSQPGRGLLDLVNSLPGWDYEANGVLHPRESEYQVQFVVDGLPLTENRSPAFAAPFEAEDSDSVRVRTAGYPAEYGRKLGGVVEITTPKDAPRGLHGQVAAGGGSFASEDGAIDMSYSRGRNYLSASAGGFQSNRYLDPPVLGNYTNSGSSGAFSVSYARELSDRSRLRLTLAHDVVDFLVPNELLQQFAGQRQSRQNQESTGAAYYQRTIGNDLLLDAQGSIRDTSAQLSSNPLSTPIIASQQRGFREGYLRTDVAGHHGRNDWKIGADALFSPVHEALQYSITDPTQFDPGVQPVFSFADRRWDREQSAFVQDQIRLGGWNISAGLRFDHYSFLVAESAWSPRLAVSRFVSTLDLLVHASYDRAFQTPAVENLLLAGSPQLNSISPEVLRLPVKPSLGNFYEVGITKGFAGKLRLDANIFRREFRDFADDDLLLNTGVSFPIAFARARVKGEEVRLEVPRWGRFSGFASYTNQTGAGQGPITGGLFLGEDVAAALTDISRFPISQDQRNTFRARLRFQAVPRLWLALGAGYGSGLPVDLGNVPVDKNFLLSQYGAAVLDSVNFATGRVRPSFSLDAGAGVDLYRRDFRTLSLLVESANLIDRVNVVNFASLFSGTAIGPPRGVSTRLRATF
jgi:carboxypeptidase family protein